MELKQYLIDRHGAVELEFPERLNISDEKYGLQFAYLEIPDPGVRIYLEMNSARMQFSSINNDAEDLIREIILWIGITKEDIENETPAFMSYADELYRFK